MFTKCNTNLVLFLIILYFITLIVVFTIPYYLDPFKYLTYPEWFSRVYGGINAPKTYTLLTIYTICTLIIITLVIGFKFCGTKTRIYATTITLFLIFSFGICILMPVHGLGGLYTYGNVKAPSMPERYINWLFVGDIQEFGSGGGRYLRQIPQYTNLRRIIGSFSDINHDNPLQGLLNPGDCTQSGEDGRMLVSHNYLSDYEAKWGLGTFKSLPIQVYECTGNHDWDASEAIWPRHILYKQFKNPTVRMINRRNLFRHGITVSDGFGNYEFIWPSKNGVYKLIFWALNVHIDDVQLMSGRPDNTITFLKERLGVYNDQNDRFIILTHTVETYQWDNIKNIFGAKISQVRGFLYGHIHEDRLVYYPEDLPLFFIGPSSDSGTDIVALFAYDTILDNLTFYQLNMSSSIPVITASPVSRHYNATNIPAPPYIDPIYKD